MSFYRNATPAAPQLKVGQVVAYDYLHNAKTWQWTLGTVREVKEFSATIQQWGLHTGDAGTLRSILSKEVDAENNRLKNFQDLLSVARDTLASIRRSNEDRVSRARDTFNSARQRTEDIDELALRKVTAQAAPSPVAVAVLKAAWAVSKCDPTAVEFYEWADVQLEYRKTNAIDAIAKTDVVAKLYPSPESLLHALEQDAKLNYKAAARDSPVVASLHSWVTTALAYQQAYSNLAHDKRIQEQNDAIASAIAGMKACRAKIATLKEELSAKNASARPGQVTSFTKTSVLMPIPLSAVICTLRVSGRVEDCVLTNDEVERILNDAKATRYQQKQKLQTVVQRLLEQYAAATTTEAYAKELEERLFFLQHCYGTVLRDAQAAAAEGTAQAEDVMRELAAHRQKRYDAKQARALDAALAAADAAAQQSPRSSTRRHTAETPSGTPNGKVRPGGARERASAAAEPVDPATIAREPLYIATAEELQKLRDDAERLARKVADQQAKLQKLDKELADNGRECEESLAKLRAALDELEDKKGENDRLASKNDKLQAEIDQLQDAAKLADSLKEELIAKDAELGAHRRKRFDAKEARANEPALAATDGAGRRHSSLGSRRRLPGAASDSASSSRAGSVAADPASIPVEPAVIRHEPLLAVTLDEYKALAAQADQEREGKDALALENDALAGELERLQGELLAARDAAAEKQREREEAANASQSLMEEGAKKDAELAAFRQKRAEAKRTRAAEPELAAADEALARQEADTASDRGSTRSTASRSSPRGRVGATRGGHKQSLAEIASEPVDPAMIAQEPLYVVTLDEFNAKNTAGQSAVDEAEKLAEELEQQKAENAKLAEDVKGAKARADRLAKKLAAKEEEAAKKDAELTAFRQKRLDARKARAREPELAAADAAHADQVVLDDDVVSDHGSYHSTASRSSPRARTDAAHSAAKPDSADPSAQPVDPAVIAQEPLYAVTVDEFNAKHAAGEEAAAEAEKLADELSAAKDEAARLADELADRDAELADKNAQLADKDAELAAFRQKRQDAKDARAQDPELAAADAGAAAAPGAGARDGAGARREAGTAGDEEDAQAGRGASGERDGDAASKPVDPAVIANEPLYFATPDEVQQLRDDLEKARQEAEALAGQNEKLADELEKLRADGDLLADQLADNDAELAAFRQKRQDAKDARARDPLLAQADGAASSGAAAADGAEGADGAEAGAGAGAGAETPRSAVDAASKPVDPAVIAQEPLYAVTVDEFNAKHAAGEEAAAEAEKLADELSAAKAEAARLADELADRDAELADKNAQLADKDAELAAFRQKRQDAKDARAQDPELAAADAGAAAAPGAGARDGAGARREAGTAGDEEDAQAGRGASGERDGDAASKPVDPAVIANEPLYFATPDEVQQLRDDLEKARQEAEALAGELAAVKEKLDDKHAECDECVAKLDAALEELEKQRDANDELFEAKGQLEADLTEQLERNSDLAGENEELRKQLAEMEEANKKLASDLANAEDEHQRLCDDLEAALDELEQKKDDYDQLLENLEQVHGLLEASKAAGRSAVDALEQRNEEMGHLQGELAEALEACKENDELRALLAAKERDIADLMRHSELWRDPEEGADAGKAKVTHRFTKIFDGDWSKLIEQRPEALMAAFVIDSSNACHVPGDQIKQVAFDHD